MTIYKNQLPQTESFANFIKNCSDTDLVTNALTALLGYEQKLPTEYEDYLVFTAGHDDEGKEIFAITKVLDEWLPVEVNDRIRKFSKKDVWEYDTYVFIKVL